VKLQFVIKLRLQIWHFQNTGTKKGNWTMHSLPAVQTYLHLSFQFVSPLDKEMLCLLLKD